MTQLKDMQESGNDPVQQLKQNQINFYSQKKRKSPRGLDYVDNLEVMNNQRKQNTERVEKQYSVQNINIKSVNINQQITTPKLLQDLKIPNPESQRGT